MTDEVLHMWLCDRRATDVKCKRWVGYSIMALWRHMNIYNSVNIGSGIGLVLEPMLN